MMIMMMTYMLRGNEQIILIKCWFLISLMEADLEEGYFTESLQCQTKEFKEGKSNINIFSGK